jgi:hypothetical protein
MPVGLSPALCHTGPVKSRLRLQVDIFYCWVERYNLCSPSIDDHDPDQKRKIRARDRKPLHGDGFESTRNPFHNVFRLRLPT